MSCVNINEGQSYNGVALSPLYVDSITGLFCDPITTATIANQNSGGNSLTHSIQPNITTSKSWFDKTFLTNGKLNSVGVGVLIAIGVAVVFSASKR